MKLNTANTEKAKALAKTAYVEMLKTFGYAMLLMWSGCLAIMSVAYKLDVMSLGFVGISAIVTMLLIQHKFVVPRNKATMLKLRDGLVTLKKEELERDRKS